jgi:YD repeat-containing protein
VDPTYNEVIDTTGCYEFFPKFSEFRGHAQVTQTGPDGVQTITQFHQDDILKGRPSSVLIRAGSQNLSQAKYTYYASTALPMATSFIGLARYWVYTSAVENWLYASDGSYDKTNTSYTYEPTYGNLTAQTEQSWNGSSWINYRTTATEYSPNNGSLYLVGLPARQQIQDAAGAVMAETLNLYDSNSTYLQVPTAGKLSAVRTWVDGALTTGRYSQTSFGYDIWGNKTTVTTYKGYGTASAAPTIGATTISTEYDSTFHVYPIRQTTPPMTNVPMGLITTWDYDYDPSIAGDDYILGVPTRETDPNGNQTSAQYDAFGRITTLIRPGDDSAHPTIFIKYYDANPFHTEIRQRIDVPTNR